MPRLPERSFAALPASRYPINRSGRCPKAAAASAGNGDKRKPAARGGSTHPGYSPTFELRRPPGLISAWATRRSIEHECISAQALDAAGRLKRRVRMLLENHFWPLSAHGLLTSVVFLRSRDGAAGRVEVLVRRAKLPCLVSGYLQTLVDAKNERPSSTLPVRRV